MPDSGTATCIKVQWDTDATDPSWSTSRRLQEAAGGACTGFIVIGRDCFLKDGFEVTTDGHGEEVCPATPPPCHRSCRWRPR